MTNFYDMTNDTIMVNESQDFLLENDENLVIDEDDIDMPEILIVEENPNEEGMILEVPGAPGCKFEEAKADDDKPKTWKEDGHHADFVNYVKDKLTKIPRHSGETVPGCERAKAFLKKLDSEISKAMRTDLKGVIDEQEIDQIRKSLEDMIDRLDRQIKKLTGKKKASMDVRLVSEGHCDKCNSSAPMWHDTINDTLVCMSCESEKIRHNDGLEKTANTPIINVYVSAFERAIVGTMINSKVSAGRNIEETYEKLKNKYNFTSREELAIQQLVHDYGYPLYRDRGLINEPSDPASGDGVDWLTNYQS